MWDLLLGIVLGRMARHGTVGTVRHSTVPYGMVRYGVLCTMCGLWYTVYCIRYAVHGVREMVHRKVCGKVYTVYGIRYTVYGVYGVR